jgi:hypothetical protein
MLKRKLDWPDGATVAERVEAERQRQSEKSAHLLEQLIRRPSLLEETARKRRHDPGRDDHADD